MRSPQTEYSLSVRFFSCLTILCFLFTSLISPVQAELLSNTLPVPGTMLRPSEAFTPVLMKGMTVNLQNPFQFDFIVHPGDSTMEGDEFKAEAQKLVKYFLAALTVPEDQLWVNLSPYEKDRIIPEHLGKTDMGYEMLAQDYILKQLTASLMYPEDETGKKFWEKVYEKAAEMGITDVPMDTFNKVWIVPNKVTVYEHHNHAFIVENTLKVMLESDYMARENSVIARSDSDAAIAANGEIASQETLAMTTMKDVVRSVIIPVIEKEVNEGKNFAPLRQIYNGMLLAAWYKKRLKQSVLGQVYADQNKVAGIDTIASSETEAVWNRYVEAFQKGAYNYIGEDYDPASGEMVSKKYFSGGVQLALPRTAAFERDVVPAQFDLASLARSFELKVMARDPYPDNDIVVIDQDFAMLTQAQNGVIEDYKKDDAFSVQVSLPEAKTGRVLLVLEKAVSNDTLSPVSSLVTFVQVEENGDAEQLGPEDIYISYHEAIYLDGVNFDEALAKAYQIVKTETKSKPVFNAKSIPNQKGHYFWTEYTDDGRTGIYSLNFEDGTENYLAVGDFKKDIRLYITGKTHREIAEWFVGLSDEDIGQMLWVPSGFVTPAGVDDLKLRMKSTFSEIDDFAMLTEGRSKNAAPVEQLNGGIDFNAAGVNMEIQMGEDGFVFPQVDLGMLEKFQINGLQMNVIQFRPLGMPVIRQMLGMESNATDKDSDVSQDPSEKAIRQEMAVAL